MSCHELGPCVACVEAWLCAPIRDEEDREYGSSAVGRSMTFYEWDMQVGVQHACPGALGGGCDTKTRGLNSASRTGSL